MITPLVALDPVERAQAVAQLADFLSLHWEGEAVTRALTHLDAASAADIDDEDLLHELTGLLHLSRISDSFGFDMLGWLPPAPGRAPRAIAIEVKSSSRGQFLISALEWAQAQRLRDEGDSAGFAVLVVRRERRRDVPTTMDLLVNPIGLVEADLLTKADDGYQVHYRVTAALPAKP